MRYKFNKITVIIGYYGSGKTNLAVNLALELSKKGTVCIVDLDIVNPYFRAADFKEIFHQNHIKLVCPQYAGTNLDVPSFCFDLEGLSEDYDYLIVDVGGDDSGAFALGKFSNFFNSCECFEMLYVFNMYRDLSVDEIVKTLIDIQKASRIKCTGLVNASNLGEITDDLTIKKSLDFADEVVEKSRLPLRFTCVPIGFKGNIDSEIFYTKRLVKMPWED